MLINLKNKLVIRISNLLLCLGIWGMVGTSLFAQTPSAQNILTQAQTVLNNIPAYQADFKDSFYQNSYGQFLHKNNKLKSIQLSPQKSTQIQIDDKTYEIDAENNTLLSERNTFSENLIQLLASFNVTVTEKEITYILTGFNPTDNLQVNPVIELQINKNNFHLIKKTFFDKENNNTIELIYTEISGYPILSEVKNIFSSRTITIQFSNFQIPAEIADSEFTIPTTLAPPKRVSAPAPSSGQPENKPGQIIGGQDQFSFNSGDINISEGTVRFTETDFSLPGKNGLGFSLARTYDSRKYRANPSFDTVFNKTWGAYMGNGWSLNVAVRAYVTELFNDLIGKAEQTLVVEDQGNLEYFTYDTTQQAFISKTPGNFTKGYFIPDAFYGGKIILKTSSGIEMTFDRLFYEENHIIYPDGVHDKCLMRMWGLYLTEVKDQFQNKIQYTYEDLTSKKGFIRKHEDLVWVDGITLEGLYKYLNDNKISKDKYQHYGQSGSLRLSKIKDTFNREIRFEYNGTSAFNQDAKVSNVKFLGTNGQEINLQYTYDINGNLTKVQKDNLPAKTYEYQNYSFPVKQYYYKKTHWGGMFGWVTDWKDFVLEINGKVVNHAGHSYNFTPNETVDYSPDFSGYLLSKRTTELGSAISYTYELHFEYMIDTGSSIADNPWWEPYDIYKEVLLKHITYPIVVSKKVSGDQNNLSYNYLYPRKTDDHLLANKIQLKSVTDHRNLFAYLLGGIWLEQLGFINWDVYYYFDKVIVDNPSQIADERYIFNYKRLNEKVELGSVSGTQFTPGPFSTETYWTTGHWLFSEPRYFPKKCGDIKKRNGVNIIENKYEYDTYYNPSKISLYKSGQLYLSTETTYVTDSTFINKNLLHLVSQTKTKDHSSTNPVRINSYSYTNEGKIAQTLQGGIIKSKFSYDTTGRITSEKVPNTNNTDLETTYSYSQGSTYDITKTFYGITTKTETFRYNLNTGHLEEIMDINSNSSKYTYDNYGRVLTTTYPDNSSDQFSYSADLKTSSATQRGQTISTTLDSFGRTIFVNKPDGFEDEVYIYYFADKVASVVKNGTTKQTMTYDLYLRPIQTTTPFGTTGISYDDANNTITKTDTKGRSTKIQMDELDRTTQTTFLADTSTQTSSYDGFNQLYQSTDAEGLIYRQNYDTYGRLTQTYYPSKTSTTGLKSSFGYFDNNLVNTKTSYDTNGSVFRTYLFNYDSENRSAGLFVNGTQEEWLTYDSGLGQNQKGKLSSAENTNVRTDYQFDNMGRVTHETITIKPINKTYTIKTEYQNTTGLVQKITYNDNKNINYGYFANQRLQNISYEQKPIVTINTYQHNSLVTKITLGNGVTIQYEYSKDVLLTKIMVMKNNVKLYQQNYNYDAKNTLTSTTHTDYLKYQADINRAYTYNIRDQLTNTAVNNTPFYNYNYDKNGNHLKYETPDNKNLSQDNISLMANSCKIAEKRFQDGRKIKCTYDGEGNLTKKEYFKGSAQTKTIQFQYNYQNQLTQVNENDGLKALYYYDHKKQRVYKYLPATNKGVIYYWDQAGHIIGEGLLNGPEHHVRYFYLGNEKIAMARNENGVEKFYYFVNNAQGTPVLILNEEGNPVSKINLDEWGNLGKVIGSKTEINFTGKKLDPETGLYYFNQRYYDPELGRFTSEDPANQFVNPYAYCANNPLIYTDPDGEFIWAVFFSSMLTGAVNGAFYGAITSFVMSHVFNQFGANIDVADATLKGCLGGAISGAILGGGSYVWENARNAISGHGFLDNDEVINNMISVGDYQKAINFTCNRYNLNIEATYDPKNPFLGDATGAVLPRNKVIVGDDAFLDSSRLKQVLYHESVHVKQGIHSYTYLRDATKNHFKNEIETSLDTMKHAGIFNLRLSKSAFTDEYKYYLENLMEYGKYMNIEAMPQAYFNPSQYGHTYWMWPW